MATYALWFWLLVNLNDDNQFYHSLSKRSIDSSGECPSLQKRKPNSFLWVIERNPPVYFFGTIHVPYTKVWGDIPDNSKQAFKNTDNIYFELDLTDPVTAATHAQCQILPNGAMLREVIPRTLYKRIRRHLSYIRKMMSAWLTMEQMVMGLTPLGLFEALTRDWYKKRPIWIMLLLNSLTEYDTKNRGTSVLDTFLIREAVSKNKKTGSIETVEEQCEPLNALNNSQVIVALNHTLVLHEKIRRGQAKLTYSTRELIYHYKCGDLTKVLFSQDLENLEKLSLSNNPELEQTRKIDKYLREELINKRNIRMAKRVVQLIQQEPKKSFFFAFGAGHFLGNGSIIDILQKQEYNVTHVHPDGPLPRYGRGRKTKNKEKGSRRKNPRKRKRRRKYRKRRKQRLRWNVENLWKRDPSWTATTKPKPVFLTTTTKRDTLQTSLPSKSPVANVDWILLMAMFMTQLVIKL